MELRIVGRIRSGSNAVFLAEEVAEDVPETIPERASEPDSASGNNADPQTGTGDPPARWVHKPVRGEAPLWDFPSGVLPPAAAIPGASPEQQVSGTLAAREIAAYLVSRAAGWDVVPETCAVITAAGPGMAQRWLDLPYAPADPEAPDPGSAPDPTAAKADIPEPVGLYDPATVPSGVTGVLALESEDGDPLVLAHTTGRRMRRIALLDAVINNADRKAGHVLLDTAGREWGIDHGLSFHTEPKVRSVLWGFAGTSLDDDELSSLQSLHDGLADGDLALSLGTLLDAAELEAVSDRIEALLTAGEFPHPEVDFPLPWPLY
ncbi:SCO1664 family protein [Dietzia sp.]|uniref:SCO1664 family protein n=1 Tax=Dietzia sp. TaxID=1871616 RepID=UPI002FD97931